MRHRTTNPIANGYEQVNFTCTLRLGMFVASILLSTPAFATDADGLYIIRTGDSIRFSVASIKDLNSKTTVDLDGNIHLPLAQSVKASGLTLGELIASIRAAFMQKAFRQQAADGRDSLVPIDPDEITVEIDEYRPVYIRGDVSKPGELAFRPGLTVRQAVALAGGYDVMRFHMDNPFLESLDLAAQYQSLWTELARDQAHMLALKAQLDGKAPEDELGGLKMPIPDDLMKDIVGTELDRTKSQVSDFTRQQNFLQKELEAAQLQLAALSKPRDEAERSEADDAAYKKRLGDLLDRGVIAHDRVAGQQRSLLESSQRLLDYSKRIYDLQRESDDFTRQSEKLIDEHRGELSGELQKTYVSIESIRAKIQAVGQKLMYTGAMKSQLVKGSGPQPEIKIQRLDANGTFEEFSADDNMALQPADVLEVSLRADVAPIFDKLN